MLLFVQSHRARRVFFTILPSNRVVIDARSLYNLSMQLALSISITSEDGLLESSRCFETCRKSWTADRKAAPFDTMIASRIAKPHFNTDQNKGNLVCMCRRAPMVMSNVVMWWQAPQKSVHDTLPS